MYSEWRSLEAEISEQTSSDSVLNPGFPVHVRCNITREVINCLATANHETSTTRAQLALLNEVPDLQTEKQLEWTMECICYALQLDFVDDHTTVHHAVEVYCSWLEIVKYLFMNDREESTRGSQGYQDQLSAIPLPIRNNPEPYIQRIIKHLFNVFVPRSNPRASTEHVQNQGGLCSVVLSNLRNIASLASISNGQLSDSTWETLLITLLKIGDVLLASPCEENDLTSIGIGDVYMDTLYDVWLRSCISSFPTPPFWKTFTDSIISWRHHPLVVEKWCNVTCILSSKLVDQLHGPGYSKLFGIKSEEKITHILENLNGNVLAQTWYRVFHLIGNPIELIDPSTFTRNTKFCSGLHEDVILNKDPNAHPALSLLPHIFYRCLRGITTVSEVFLGWHTPLSLNDGLLHKSYSPCPRVEAEHPEKTTVNSLLHLVGDWLFSCGFAGLHSDDLGLDENDDGFDTRSHSAQSSLTAHSTSTFNVSEAGTVVQDMHSTEAGFIEGRAEAVTMLCRIFTQKASSEEVEQVYIVRFYAVISRALKSQSPRLISAVVLNAEDLFRVDLPGVEMLIPLVMSALDRILPDSDLKFFEPFCESTVTLRKCAANLLLSLIPYIITLPDLQVVEIPGIDMDDPEDIVDKLGDLQPRAVHLLNGALETETNEDNTHIILAGLYYTLQECSSREKDCLTNPNAPRGGLGNNGGSGIGGKDLSRNATRSFQLHSAYGLFVQCLNTLNGRLLSHWKNSLNITMAVFELLAGMARLRIDVADPGECKRSVMALCEYISVQSNRPSREHKRELHSMIVAAYNCLSVWITEHRYLLHDKGCLLEVLETIEFGISGSPSHDRKKVAKDEKTQKPISRRVKNAAEALLILIFHDNTDPQAHHQTITESVLTELLNEPDQPANFRYFSINGNTLISFIEHEKQAFAIIRGPFGKQCIQFTYNHGAPIPVEFQPKPQGVHPPPGNKNIYRHKFFPDSVKQIPKVKSDYSIPNLKDILTSTEDTYQLEQLRKIYRQQVGYEQAIIDSRLENPSDWPSLRPETQSKNFSPVRTLIENIGFTKNHGNDDKDPIWMPQRFSKELEKEIAVLDKTSGRNLNTVFVFYQGKSLKYPGKNEVLQGATSQIHDETFLEFILSLGYPVNTETHNGWTGRMENSYNSIVDEAGSTDESDVDPNQTDDIEINPPHVFDSTRYSLYHSDDLNETAFVVPGLNTKLPNKVESKSYSSRIGILWKEQSTNGESMIPTNELLKDLTKNCCKTGLETPRDQHQIPFIIIESLKSGLYKTCVLFDNKKTAQLNSALPITPYMVVGKSVLGVLVRDTIRNVSFRQRIVSHLTEGYHSGTEIPLGAPPHAKRRQLVGVMSKSHRTDLSEEQVICRLLNDASVEVEGIRKTTEITNI